MDIQQIINQAQSDLAVAQSHYKIASDSINSLCEELCLDPKAINIQELEGNIQSLNTELQQLESQIIALKQEYDSYCGTSQS